MDEDAFEWVADHVSHSTMISNPGYGHSNQLLEAAMRANTITLKEKDQIRPHGGLQQKNRPHGGLQQVRLPAIMNC